MARSHGGPAPFVVRNYVRLSELSASKGRVRETSRLVRSDDAPKAVFRCEPGSAEFMSCHLHAADGEPWGGWHTAPLASTLKADLTLLLSGSSKEVQVRGLV